MRRGHGPAVTDGAVKKHRHDLGQEDHGPVMAANTTRGIQIVLALWIAGTVFAMVGAAIDAGRSVPARRTPSAGQHGGVVVP
jgi:hypothetical protein